MNFYVKNYNIGGAPEVFLGADVRDIPAGATVEFTTGWVPPSTGHFCIVVRIPLYVVPTAPTVVEMTELNNVAQSNYDRFVSATGSPSTREEAFVEVGNPYNKPTRVWIIGQQTNPLYRSYIDTTWVLLEPGEARRVKVMVEYALDPKSDHIPDDIREFKSRIEKLQRIPNDLGLHTYVEDPNDDPRHALELLGGAQVQVATGRRSRFDSFGNDGNVVLGAVVTDDDGAPVDGGIALVTITRDPDAPQDYLSVPARVEQGKFSVKIPRDDWRFTRAEFLPPPGYGPAETDWQERR